MILPPLPLGGNLILGGGAEPEMLKIKGGKKCLIAKVSSHFPRQPRSRCAKGENNGVIQ